MRLSRLIAALAAVLLLSAIGWMGIAHAAFPVAQNGRIVFQRVVAGTPHVFVMNADGSNPVDLSPASTKGDFDPQFSPNGQWIVFERALDPDGTFHVFRMRWDGTGAVDLTPGLQGAGAPTFSPDSKQIAFVMDTNPALNAGFYTAAIMNADGSGVTNLTPGDESFERRPDFSPDGTRVIFDREQGSTPVLMSVAPNGSNLVKLTPTGQVDVSGRFSPTGTQIAWSRQDMVNDFDIFVGDTNLGGATDLTPNGSSDQFKQSPAFSPDASKIGFNAYGFSDSSIYLMGAAGGAAQDLSPATNPQDSNPAWEYIYMCAKRRATIVGSDAPETIKGTKKADVIVGNGGNDKIKGKGGNDRICGGRGNDRLIGGAGKKDRLNGGPGKDKVKQ